MLLKIQNGPLLLFVSFLSIIIIVCQISIQWKGIIDNNPSYLTTEARVEVKSSIVKKSERTVFLRYPHECLSTVMASSHLCSSSLPVSRRCKMLSWGQNYLVLWTETVSSWRNGGATTVCWQIWDKWEFKKIITTSKKNMKLKSQVSIRMMKGIAAKWKIQTIQYSEENTVPGLYLSSHVKDPPCLHLSPTPQRSFTKTVSFTGLTTTTTTKIGQKKYSLKGSCKRKNNQNNTNTLLHLPLYYTSKKFCTFFLLYILFCSPFGESSPLNSPWNITTIILWYYDSRVCSVVRAL